MEIHPSLLSKASTFLQLVTVTAVLFALQQPSIARAELFLVLFGLTAAMTAVSGIQYVVRGLRWYQRVLASS
jgi:phosphatidylglycerophosphate synthase